MQKENERQMPLILWFFTKKVLDAWCFTICDKIARVTPVSIMVRDRMIKVITVSVIVCKRGRC
jgi:hypothetical protein